MVGLFVVLYLSQTDMPHPQSYTELYFTDLPKQSSMAIAGTEQKLPFTIHNHERRTTTYHYLLMATSVDSSAESQMGEGVVVLTPDHAQTIDSTIILPSFGKRAGLKIVLSYESVSPTDGKLSSQTQSIHHWLNVVKAHNNRNEHASS